MEHNAILDSKLSLSSNIPLYAQLVGIIKQNISSGELNVGDLLPSEAELCRTMGISRNTVRQAIGELEEEGLVVRKRGKGTFVAEELPAAGMDLSSLTGLRARERARDLFISLGSLFAYTIR